LSKPLSCFGGEEGAEDGRPMYNCGTSAPVTVPLFVIVTPTVATTAYNPAVPPGMVVVLPAAVLSDEIVRPEYAKVV
jgi:hypothetical protein